MNSTTKNIVKSNLRANKLRSILIIITIALTTTLLVSIGNITLNMVEGTKQNIVKSAGNAHGFYRKLEEKDIETLKRHKDIDIIGENSFVLGKNEYDDSQLSFMYLDENALKMSNMEIIEGRVPVGANEIALDKTLLKKLGYKGIIGEKIKLSYNDINKKFIEKEFILSGILPINEMGEENNLYSAVVSKNLIEEEGYPEVYKASIRLKNEETYNGDSIREKMEEIASILDIDEENIQFNDMYLFWMKPDPTTIMIAVVVALIVMFSSILVIYNIFYISIVSKIQEFGKLKALGTTKKQIKSIVLREGIILSLVSIPIGIIVGYIISNLIMNTMMKDYGIALSGINIPIIIGSAILTLITVYISLLKPMKIAAKISPVEAIKYNGSSDNPKKKTRKGYDSVNVLKLTKANLGRNKKRTIMTLLSLSLSGILIMVASTIMSSMNTENMVREGMPGDFQFTQKYVGFDYDKEEEEFIKNNPFNDDFMNSIQEVDGVKSVNLIREISGVIENKGGKYKEIEPDLKEIDIDVAGYDEDIIKDLQKQNVKEGKINLDKLKSGEEVIINGGTKFWYGLNVGDSVKIKTSEGINNINNKEVKVQAIVKAHYGGEIITLIDNIKNDSNANYNSSVSVVAKDGSYDQVLKSLNNILSSYKNIELKDFKESVKQNDKAFFATNSMGYGLVSIIGAISLVNLVNTMVSSIMSRKRELGILQSIGMTDKQLMNMLKLEGLFYTGITLISSIGLGGIIGYIVYIICYNTGMSGAAYKFPMLTMIILIAVISLVQLFMGNFINKIFKKESLIDRVRYSE